ncbi:MAG: hypothetical protein HXY48_02630 [Ignavibacteriaceae bacterium]|nr:hypothetical protein [Ignavibacteriaceae bacterium]
MKKLFTIVYCISSINSFAQDYQECIDSLYSNDYYTKFFAVECVNALEIQSASSIIEALLENQPPSLQIQFLNALYTLENPNVQVKAHELILRADDFDDDPEHPYDPLEAKVFATAILVYKGDYSTIEFAFEQLNQNQITIEDVLALHLLPYIMKDIPSYRDEAKNILIDELENTSTDIRYYSLLYLAEEFGSEMNDELVNKFINDDDLPTKIMALEHLCINNYSELNLLLKQQLELEEEWSFRIDMADSLLFRFGEPSDLKAVIDYQPNEPNETAKSLMAYSIEDFIPPKPDTLDWSELTTKLITYTDELLQYGWIANQQTKDFYTTKLQDIITVINQTKEIDSACTILNGQLLPQVEQDLQQELISTEGYKFLHYYMIYIKEEIEQEYGPCP